MSDSTRALRGGTVHDSTGGCTIRKRYGLIGVASLGALLLAGSVAAMRDVGALVAPSKITIRHNAAAKTFSGKVSSKNKRCVARRRVRVKEVLPGPDRTVAVAVSNLLGKWETDVVTAETGQTQDYQGVVVRDIERSKKRPLLTCGAATSRTIEVAPPPFTLGPTPVAAIGTFTNGQGGCGFPPSFRASFQFLAPGNSRLTISQGPQKVEGPITPSGSYQVRSASESYDGEITGNTSTARYSYTANGCTGTWDVSFVLER